MSFPGSIKSGVDSEFVNSNNSNYSAMFSSNTIPGLPGLSGAKYNVDAAASRVPGLTGGSAKNFKRKLKNITKMYKMKGGKKTIHNLKKRIRSRYSKKMTKTHKHKKGGKTRRVRRVYKGGYSQYQNNLPMTPTYSLGGELASANSALANPPPHQVLSNCTNCTDNYNHFTGKGFPSAGH